MKEPTNSYEAVGSVMVPYNTCSIIQPSHKFLAWDLLTEEELDKPLRVYKDRDILTTQTMLQLKDNNDKVKNSEAPSPK